MWREAIIQNKPEITRAGNNFCERSARQILPFLTYQPRLLLSKSPLRTHQDSLCPLSDSRIEMFIELIRCVSLGCCGVIMVDIF